MIRPLLAQTVDWWSSLEKRAKAITAIVAVIAAVGAGACGLDVRYAKAEDMKAQISGVKQLYLRSERRAVEKELFSYEVLKKKRPLTDLEHQRVRHLEQELKEIQEDLEAAKPAK